MSDSASGGPRSMTGFGTGLRSDGKTELRAELRSVNHRGLVVRTNLPAELASFESAIESKVRERLGRGSVTITLRSERIVMDAALDFDEELARSYAAKLRALAQSCQLAPVPLSTILSLPGVTRTVRHAAPDEPDVLEVVDEALDALIACRVREGEHLAAEILRITDGIAARVDAIEKRWPDVVREYGERIERRIVDFLVQRGHAVEDVDVVREVAIWADRADVAEEVVRFRAHLDELRRLLAGGDVLGRRLEFLGQELLREANTMASKASDAALAQEVVEIKSALDRIKEQGQNLE